MATQKSRRTDNKDLLMIACTGEGNLSELNQPRSDQIYQQKNVLEIVRNEKILPDEAERAFWVDFGHNSCPLLNSSYLR